MLVVGSSYPQKKKKRQGQQPQKQWKETICVKGPTPRTNNLEPLQPPETWKAGVQHPALRFTTPIYKHPLPKVTELRCNTLQWFALCLHSGERYNREASMAKQNQPEPSLRSQNCMSKRSYQYRKRIGLPIISKLSKCSVNFNATCKSFRKPISRINAQCAHKTQ